MKCSSAWWVFTLNPQLTVIIIAFFFGRQSWLFCRQSFVVLTWCTGILQQIWLFVLVFNVKAPHCTVTLTYMPLLLFFFFDILATVLQQGHTWNVWQHPPQAVGDASWCVQLSLVSPPGPAGERRHTQTGIQGWLREWDYSMHLHCPDMDTTCTARISCSWAPSGGRSVYIMSQMYSHWWLSQLTFYKITLRLLFILHFQNEIKAHSFFSSINWDDLEQKKIPPPFTPSVVNICFLPSNQ